MASQQLQLAAQAPIASFRNQYHQPEVSATEAQLGFKREFLVEPAAFGELWAQFEFEFEFEFAFEFKFEFGFEFAFGLDLFLDPLEKNGGGNNRQTVKGSVLKKTAAARQSSQ